MPLLPYTPKNNDEITQRIENAKGPVGPGHHNSHRTANIQAWLQQKEGKGGSKTPPVKGKAAAYVEATKKVVGGKK